MKLRTWCIRIGQLLTKTGLALNIALLLMLVCCFANVAHAESSYTQGITIRRQNAPLEKIFQSIEKQTGYRFFYNESLLEGATRVTLNLQNASLQEVLDACFVNQPFSYAIVERTIIIKRKVVAVPRAVVNAPLNKIIAVRGKVTSGNAPVVGATVAVKGTDNATSTDVDGVFTLSEVDDQGTLVVSHVAHEAREVRLKGQRFLAIDLNEKINDLDEAVVVAYNTTTQKRNTGSITVVKGAQVATLPNRSIDKSLQGLVPGLLVTSGDGQPGSGLSNFVLRGIATGSDGTRGATVRNPLMVIDGVPVNQDHQQWTIGTSQVPVINPMANLNPADIESITVLKDAAAIALYGSKASNGVILITTKKGKLGKTVVSLQHQTDLSTSLNGKIELLNQDEYLELLYETYKNTNAALWTDSAILADLRSKFPNQSDGSFYPASDWNKEMFTDLAPAISTNLSVSGGNERNTFYLNFEYTKQNGTAKGTGYERKSIRYNFENRLSGWLKFGLNAALSHNVQDYLSLVGGMPGNYMRLSPLYPVYLEDGSLLYNLTYPNQQPNPVAARKLNAKRNITYRGLSKLFIELTFLKNFRFTSNLGFDFMLTEAKEKIDPRIYDTDKSSVGSGRIQERDTRNANLISTNILSFNKTFSANHSVNILLGQEAQTLNQKYLEAISTNLKLANDDQINDGNAKTASGLYSKQTLLSYFSQVNYGYKNKYLFTGSVRRDGSSLFGERNRYGTYWSLGAGWIISDESFMRATSSWLDFLKIRGSIGAAGNSAAISQLTRYDVLWSYSYLGNTAVVPYQPGNPDIKWEQTFNWDAGLELRFLKNRIAFTADIYKRNTSDVIYNMNLAPVNGWTSVLENIGNIENKGTEISLSLDIVRTKDLKYNLTGNWSTNKNILTKANVPLSTVTGNTLANEVGRNFNSFYLVQWAGVNSDDGIPQWMDSTGKPGSNYNAAKRQFVGKPQPDGYGSITNTVTFKNFQFSALLYYQYGYQLYNTFFLTNDGFSPYDNQDKNALDRWQKQGDIASNPKRTLNNSAASRASTRNLIDGDHIRLQNVTISYAFSQRVTKALHLSSLRTYVQGYNLATITKFSGSDIGGANVQGGINLAYPNQKSFSIGVNLNF